MKDGETAETEAWFEINEEFNRLGEGAKFRVALATATATDGEGGKRSERL